MLVSIRPIVYTLFHFLHFKIYPMKKAFAFACCFIAIAVSAQSTFETTIAPNILPFYEQKTIQLKDGSYVMLCSGDGVTGSSLVKLNAAGTVVAQKTVGKSVSSITPTSDTGFAVAGVINNGDDSVVFVKYDSSLNEQVALRYYINLPVSFDYYHFQSANSIIQTPDGGFIIAGTGHASHHDANAYFFKINNHGVYVPNSIYSLELNTIPKLDDITITKDGNLVLLCSLFDEFAFTYREFIIKTTVQGDDGSSSLLWGNEIYFSGDTSYIGFQTLTPTSDSGFVFIGYLKDGKSAMFKMDVNGNVIWSKYINIPPKPGTGISDLVESKDGGYIFAGAYTSPQIGTTDTTIGYLVKLTRDGVLQATKTFQNTNDVSFTFTNITPATDRGFAAVGYTGNFNLGQYNNVIIYKFDSTFNTCSSAYTNETVPVVDTEINKTSSGGFTALGYDIGADTPSLVQETLYLKDFSSCSNILPLHLLSFNAILQNKTVNVAWKTANETDEDHFVVERSPDARTFGDLQSVTAKGNGNSSIESYASVDLHPLTGTSYYRLREVDKDGAVTYSNIVSVTVLANGTIVISPNPVHDNLHVLLQSRESGEATFVVSDVTGKIVAKQKNTIVEGTNTFHIPAASLSTGLYVLKVIQNNTVQSVKFIKQ